jgi:hypothetical protein
MFVTILKQKINLVWRKLIMSAEVSKVVIGAFVNAQGSVGDPLIAPCRSFYQYFDRKIILSDDLKRSFWQTARRVASVVGLPLAVVALIGGTANLLCIPFVWVVNYLVAEKKLASYKQQMIKAIPNDVDKNKAMLLIEHQVTKIQSVIRSHSWKAKLICKSVFRFGGVVSALEYEFTPGLWWAAKPVRSWCY